jgi:hypothetical protein
MYPRSRRFRAIRTFFFAPTLLATSFYLCAGETRDALPPALRPRGRARHRGVPPGHTEEAIAGDLRSFVEAQASTGLRYWQALRESFSEDAQSD